MHALRTHKTLWVGLAAMGILAGTLLLAHYHVPGPPCLFRLLTGIPCPGCGMTRSLMALWRGDLLTSFRYHPLGPPLFLACLFLLMALLLRRLPKLAPETQRRLWTGIGALLIGVWLVRFGFAIAGNPFFLW
jgi:hypothetical protein